MGACGSSGHKGRDNSSDDDHTSVPATAAATPADSPKPAADAASNDDQATSQAQAQAQAQAQSQAQSPSSTTTPPATPTTVGGERGLKARLDAIEDEYEMGQPLGSGAFSIVKRATSKRTGESFAVKCIAKSMVENEISMENLRREITNLQTLNHRHILKLYEVFENEADIYLVMELVEGSELFDKIIANGRYSEPAAANVTAQLSAAVGYLHDNGIAHRDLKPENILCSGEGADEIVKVADFGLSKNFGEAYLQTSCGSPAYVAPEVLMCEQYSNAVDMWSIGVILYALLVGYPPFDTEDPQLFARIMAANYDFAGPGWENISDEAKALVRRLMCKDVDGRITAREVPNDPWIAKHCKKS